MRRIWAWIISIVTFLFGTVLASIWFYWGMVDWEKLKHAETAFDHNPGIKAGFIQQMHRDNMIAEIIGMHGSAIMAAIGALGIILILLKEKK